MWSASSFVMARLPLSLYSSSLHGRPLHCYTRHPASGVMIAHFKLPKHISVYWNQKQSRSCQDSVIQLGLPGFSQTGPYDSHYISVWLGLMPNTLLIYSGKLEGLLPSVRRKQELSSQGLQPWLLPNQTKALPFVNIFLSFKRRIYLTLNTM